MKFTIVFTTLLCVSTSWAVQSKSIEDSKDKREAPVSYGAPSYAAHTYQTPAQYSQGDASAVSIGAGYSIGGAKPSYSFAGQGSSGGIQIPSEGLSPNGHATIQLAPITLQPGQQFGSGDLSQIMNQLSHSFNAGGLSLQPSNAIAEFHQGGDSLQSINQGQLSFPQFSYGAPKYEISQQYSSAPAYSAGTKGLSSYTSTGPVLFTPSDSQSAGPAAPALSYGATNAANLGDLSSYSLSGAGQSFGGSPHALSDSTHSLGASGHSLGDSSNSLAGLSLGGAGNSFGGFGGYKQLSGGYSAPGKTSFKPSTYIGSSVQGESGHGISSLSGSYASPSFGSYRSGSPGGLSLASAGHGASYGGSFGGFGSGSTKFSAPTYQSAKSEELEGISTLSSGHFASPPGTTYGIPSSSYSSNNVHAASSSKPYYVSSKHHRAHSRSPAHSSPSSFSSRPNKYSFGSASSHYEPNDAHISASETSYNTIKFSEELKPLIN